MSAAILEPQIFDELKAALNHGVESGELLTPLQIEQQTALFRDRFGPAVLRELDGEALRKRPPAKQGNLAMVEGASRPMVAAKLAKERLRFHLPRRGSISYFGAASRSARLFAAVA